MGFLKRKRRICKKFRRFFELYGFIDLEDASKG
jgi:hypothetical protein